MKSLKIILFIVAFSICASPLAHAQTSSAASVDVFLANDGGVDNATMQRAYKAVAATLTQRDGFRLVAQDQASLVVSLRCIDKNIVRDGNTTFDHIIRLAVIDPATHQSLWTAEERGPFPAVQLGDGHIWGKNFTKVATKLADDLHQAQTSGQFTVANHSTS